MIAYTRQGAKISNIERGGICTPTDCIRRHPKGIKGELRAKREREALLSKGAGEPTLDYMATGMGLQVVELEGRLEVMKESQEERQILEIGQAAPQSPRGNRNGRQGGFREAACKRYDREATGWWFHFNNRYYPGSSGSCLWCYPNSD